jgi:hypothetical protein
VSCFLLLLLLLLLHLLHQQEEPLFHDLAAVIGCVTY